MRQGTASSIRSTSFDVSGRLPREGSKLREVYDLFMANPGKPIFFSSTSNRGSNHLSQLKDYYGLDIRKTGKRERVLAGQYDHKGNYISYMEKPNEV